MKTRYHRPPSRRRTDSRRARRGHAARGRRVIEIEARAVAAIGRRLGAAFDRAVEAILGCRGKVVVTGMGKSGHIGRKVAATMSSTGTPAVYLHSGEAGHGDLGVVAEGDLLLAFSHSGESDEVAEILPAVRRLGVPVVAVTGRPDSTLGRAADIVLDASVREEACPMGLAPTASTTAALALGDALAVAVYEARGLTPADFAARHPGGALGRALLTTVADLMHTGEEVPAVSAGATMREALVEMTRKRLGFTTVLDARGRLTGIITDGDLRRLLQKDLPDLLDRRVEEVMTPRPRTIEAEALAARALRLMEERKITSLVVPHADGTVRGVIHLHDILQAKIDAAVGA